MAIHHYDSRDGISGYRAGDVLIEVATGDTMRAVQDGRGVALEPTLADVPFDAAEQVGRIAVRVAPLDVGFDLRGEDVPVHLPPGAALRVSYATPDGERRVVSGPRADVAQHLRRQGYRLA